MSQPADIGKEIKGDRWQDFVVRFLEKVEREKKAVGGFGTTCIEITWRNGIPHEINVSESACIRVK